MTRSILAGGVAIALFFAAAPLAAQDPRLTDRFAPPVAARLSATVDSAAHDGLPADPLVLRALEGQAKGATTDQIVAAVARLRDVLRTARTTLGTAASPIELTTAAAALQAGLPPTRLAELHKLRGNLPVTAPLNAYLDLTARGAPADRAWNRIYDLVRERASDTEFLHLTPADIGHDTPVDWAGDGTSGKGFAMRIGTSLVVLLGCCAAAPLAGQVHVETGGGQSRLDQLPASSLTAFGGGLDANFGHAHLQFSGGANDHIGLGVDGTLSAALRYQFRPGNWRIEAGPVSDAARGIGERWSTTIGGDLSAERDIGPVTLRGTWQQGVANTGAQQESWRRPIIAVEARAGAWQFGASWQGTYVQDSVVRDNLFLLPGDARADSTYRGEVRDIQDMGVKAAWAHGPLMLDGRVGRRWGANIAPQVWWETHAALRITPIMALTVRTGRLATDALLSMRGGQYTTFGLRLDMLPRKPARDRAGVNDALAQVVRESASTVHLYFTMPPGTRQVAVSSDLTEWKPVSLARTDDGRWEAVLPATVGVYRINLSADNGPWRVPPGLPATDDGFGAKVGLLVLER